MTEVQSLIICVSVITDENFLALKAQSVEFTGAEVVQSVDELQLAVGLFANSTYIYNNSNDAINPAFALANVVKYGGDAAYVASGDGLTGFAGC